MEGRRKRKPKTSGNRITHRKVRVIVHENGKKRTYWNKVPLFPHPSNAASTSPLRRSNLAQGLGQDGGQNTTVEFNQHDPLPFEEGNPKPPTRTYAERKKNCSNDWQNILPQLQEAFLSSHAPSSYLCSFCGAFDENIIFCRDCGPSAYFCYPCGVKIHRVAFLHVPLIWKGRMFGPLALEKILATPNHNCGTIVPGDVTLIDHSGRQHKAIVHFCSCTSKPCKLMSLGFWPASPKKPSIAIDLRLMDLCRIMLLEGSMAIQKFATTINIHSCRLPNCGTEVNLYRSLIMDCTAYHRRFAYDVDHLQGIVPDFPDGSECPTCTKTADQLPKVVSMDGNFRLVRKKKSGTSDLDPHHKKRFFLPDAVLQPFLSTEQVAHTETCSGFKAGDPIRSTFKTKGLDVTGVFGSICVHDYPQFFLDMNSGEKLGYAVCVIQKLLQMHDTRHLNIMYDVACRLLPQMKKSKLDCSRVTLAVPVFHGFAHILKCQTLYNPKNIFGFRLADGENTERLWSYMGEFVYITREMTPSNRRDLLVDALLHWAAKALNAAAFKMVRRVSLAKDLKKVTQKELDQLIIEMKACGLDVTKAVVREWEKKLKARYTDKTKKTAAEWDEEYATQLNLWFSHRWRTPETALESEEIEAHATLKRVEDKLKAIEEVNNVARWEAGSQEFKAAMQKVRSRKAHEVLQKLQFEASDRKQLLFMKNKARGHDRAAKLAEQIKNSNSRIKRQVQQYNHIVGTRNLTEDIAKDTSAAIYGTVTLGDNEVPFPVRRELILKYNTIDRAQEEVDCTKIEMPALLSWYQEIHLVMEESILLVSPPVNQIQEGAISLILLQLVQNERQQILLTQAMELMFEIKLIPDRHYLDFVVSNTMWMKDFLAQKDLELEDDHVAPACGSAESDDALPSDEEE